MSTKTVWTLPSPAGGFDVDTVNKGLLPNVLPNGKYKNLVFVVAAPDESRFLSAVYVKYRPLSVGNLYLRFSITRTSSSGVTTQIGTWATYAGANALGTPAFITVPAALVALFTTVVAGDILGIVPERDGEHASDTYEEDLELLGVMSVFDITSTPGAVARYCVQADLERRISVALLAQLTNDTINAATPDANVVNDVIADAADHIDSIAGRAYEVPFVTVPPIIKKLCIEFACYDAMQRRPTSYTIPESWNDLNKKNEELLEKIATREVHLGTGAIAVSASSIQTRTTSRIVDFEDTTNQMSEF